MKTAYIIRTLLLWPVDSPQILDKPYDLGVSMLLAGNCLFISSPQRKVQVSAGNLIAPKHKYTTCQLSGICSLPFRYISASVEWLL